MSHAQRKLAKLEQVKRLLLTHPDGISFKALREAVEADQSSVNRYLHELGARQVERGIWMLDVTQDDVELAEAVLEAQARQKGLIMSVLVSRQFVNEINAMSEEDARAFATERGVTADDWGKTPETTLFRAGGGSMVGIKFETTMPIEQCDISAGFSHYNRMGVDFSTSHYAAAAAMVLTSTLPDFKAQQYDLATEEFNAAIDAHEAAQGRVAFKGWQ